MAAFPPSHRREKPMFDFDVSCPQCEEKFKLNRVSIVDVQNLKRILSQDGKGIMRIDQRIMDAKTKTIYRVTRIEENLIILTAEDESDELVIRNNKSRDLK
jgi:hypothetical protein